MKPELCSTKINEQEVKIPIERGEARVLLNRIAEAVDIDWMMLEHNRYVEKLLKKRGIDNAIPPYEVVISISGASLIYREAP